MKNRVEIVSKRKYNTRDLAAACEAVNLSMLGALLDPLPAADVSEGFSVRVNRQHGRFVRAQRVKRIGRSAAAVALALLVFLSAVLTVNASAREAFVRWWKTVLIDRVVYYFEGSPEQQTPSGFSLGWVPEGFVLEDAYYEDHYGNLFYVCAGKTLTYEYSLLGEVDVLDIIGTEECESIQIGENCFDYYQDLSGGSNIMIWVNDAVGYMHMLNGDLNREELLQIVLNINSFY